MTKSRNSDRNNQSALDDAQLEIVVGGAMDTRLAKMLAERAVGGWIMQDIWTRPTLGTYH
ncbi:hypothetical protein [Bradyrhizobium sp. JYMT SZCCT0180]|uniref:hypothetical protein n=1 Tax=Bradyrhizobium sp. JYMT SZCCT0180 TaxID=2807666 RepID=UPI001BAE2E8E|nr:hypothetical protein [Bradyrhizobium sp. JYMT SZCCT0180]MBR1215474.1 hypothetical protein [Bradyrhizobium sp. JYMT SZCCT0180]